MKTPWIVGGSWKAMFTLGCVTISWVYGSVQVPLDHPVPVDQVRKVGGRRHAGEREVLARRVRLQDAAPIEHVAFLQYGRSAAA